MKNEIKAKLIDKNEEYDYIGMLTPLFDIDGKPLYTGDTIEYINDSISIVCTKNGNIMGIWGTTQYDIEHFEVRKIKSYKELKNKEIINFIKVVFDKEENKYKTEGATIMKPLSLKEQLEELQLQTKEIEAQIKQEDIDKINQIDEKIATYKVKRTEVITGEQYISKDKIQLNLDNSKEMNYDITYRRKGNKVICTFSNDYIVGKGISRCCEEDTFDYMVGVGIAELRARSDFYKKNAERLIRDTDRVNSIMGSLK